MQSLAGIPEPASLAGGQERETEYWGHCHVCHQRQLRSGVLKRGCTFGSFGQLEINVDTQAVPQAS